MANGMGRKKSLTLSTMISRVGIFTSFPFTSYRVLVMYVFEVLSVISSLTCFTSVRERAKQCLKLWRRNNKPAKVY